MAALFLLSAASLLAPGLSVPLRSSGRDLEMCRDQPNFFRIAHTDSCIKYYQCYSGQAYTLLCPDFTWFNEAQQICDDENAPPEGCEVAQPPIVTPPPETEEETPETEEETPETEEETPETPEVPEENPEEEVEQPEEEVEQPEEEDEGSGEADGEPEGTEEPKIESAESEDDSKNETNEEEVQPPIEELSPPSESEESSTNEPESEVNTEEPDLETEESKVDEIDALPIEVLEVSEEGSGDVTTAEETIEEGSGFGLLPNLLRRPGKSEEETPVGVIVMQRSESSEAFPEDHGLDLELDELILLKAAAKDDVVYEIPSIEPVFVLPQHDK